MYAEPDGGTRREAHAFVTNDPEPKCVRHAQAVRNVHCLESGWRSELLPLARCCAHRRGTRGTAGRISAVANFAGADTFERSRGPLGEVARCVDEIVGARCAVGQALGGDVEFMLSCRNAGTSRQELPDCLI